ncbi:PAS domain-containing protein [Sphingomonas profundi]|uniref:PAS domain-containing protein n=1 Tax=Alterirhizorhabdus profundi TaxID=2681549 RepID=UPI0018D05C50|nr:PAS domain-containing protein [Sphingomonas profundi]
MAERVRAHDWAATPLGPMAGWPQSLKTTVDLMLASGHAMCLAWGPEQTFLYNDAYAPLMGDRHPAAIGLTFAQAWPDVWADIAPLVRRTLSGETVTFQGLHLVMTRHGGREDTWWDFSYSPVRDESGAVAGLLNVTLEATGRVHAERDRDVAVAQLRRNEARLRTLVNASSDVVYTMSPDWTEMRKLDGRGFIADTAAPSIRWIDEYLLPEDQAGILEAIGKAVAEKGIFELEHRVRRADGTVGWTFSRGIPVLDDRGDIVEWFGMAADVTARHDAVHALRASEEFSRRILESSADCIKVLSLDAHLEFMSDGGMCVMEVDDFCSVAGAWWPDFWSGDEHRRVLAALEVARSGGVGRFQGAAPTFKGSPRFWDVAVSAITDEAGRPEKLLAISRDVTEQRASEDALRQLNETLESRVEERSRELVAAEDRVRHMQKMEAIGQLTGGVAHDFNNLLTIIRSSAELLSRWELTADKRQRYIDAIASTADRAAKLTGQLLAFARRQALRPEVFDVAARVATVADMLRSVVGTRVDLTVDPVCAPCFVEVDASQFETALVNMAVNARDAMDGEGRLAIVVEEAAGVPPLRGHAGAQGDFVRISVIDAGSGMTPEQLDHIFEPFYTTKEVGKGTGLGLSQVYGFTKQSGGEVEVVSEPGKGTTFRLYLPRVQPPAEQREDAPDDTGVAGEASILIVEDNEQVGEFAAQLLDDLGYTTRYAANARDALGILERDHATIDILFSDVVMPGVDGVQLARQVQARWPEIRIVLVSGYSHVLAGDARHGFDLLHKPYSADELSRVLDVARRARGERRR